MLCIVSFYFTLKNGIYIYLSRFRLVAKSMAAFLAAQMPNDSSLRLDALAPGAMWAGKSPGVPLSPQHGVAPSMQAVQALAHVESLRGSKQYAAYRQEVDVALGFICTPRYSLRDSVAVLMQLTSRLFPDVVYLAVMLHSKPQLTN